VRKVLPGGYELDDDPARIDLDGVHRFIAEESYWAAGRTRETMRALIERADRVVGVYLDGAQVGFARTVDVPDASLTYLADVYVLSDHRGQGLGVELVRFSIEEGPFAANRWVLHTKDAHELYAKFGFVAGDRLLERPRR
jgi:GNAT superfamily N-acetyltransferase